MVSKLTAFFERYPGIAVEFVTSESPTSLIEDGFDLAIHSGDLPDSSLVVRRFAQTLTILVATPQFLARHSLPRSIVELRSLPAIPFFQNGAVQAWEFSAAFCGRLLGWHLWGPAWLSFGAGSCLMA